MYINNSIGYSDYYINIIMYINIGIYVNKEEGYCFIYTIIHGYSYNLLCILSIISIVGTLLKHLFIIDSIYIILIYWNIKVRIKKILK
jgi:hypothetical protein